MIAIPSGNGALPERTPDKLDLEHSKRDIGLVRKHARRGVLRGDRLARVITRLEDVAQNGLEERLRVAADKALAAIHLASLKILADVAKQPDKQTASVTNQQINIYLPDNGRGNGKH